MMRDKKGQEMSISTLVLIVIGIIVLVLLILGFSYGWQNLIDKINIFGGGSDVSTVIQSCGISASAGDKYSYCSDFKLVKIGSEKVYVNCLSNQVATSLSTKLTCDKSGEDYEKDFCNTLSASAQGTTKVVSSSGVGAGTFKTCTEVLGTAPATTCDSLGGKLTNGATCLTGKSPITAATDAGGTTGKICCTK
jgi:hypothetical protein